MNEIRSLTIEVGGGQVWVEKVKVRTTAPAKPRDAEQVPDTAIGELSALFNDVKSDLAKLSDVKFDLSDVAKKLPGELKDATRFDDPDWLRAVLAEAESRLITRLVESEEAE
jgi:hypothetical protein